jgi:hypothetical protein
VPPGGDRRQHRVRREQQQREASLLGVARPNDRHSPHHDRAEERYLVGRVETQQERTLVPDRCDGRRLDGQAEVGEVEGGVAGFIDDSRQQLFTTAGGACHARISISTRTGGTRRRPATARQRLPSTPVASAFALGSGQAADGFSSVTTEVLPEVVNLRREHCLPNCCRNAALRHEQSQLADGCGPPVIIGV